ncbi:hypothetical protein Goklo_001664 [Gossypium klotzschianum]|uniref:Uncharacterized protein n=1 Tax=Gossypium klotzschianum TaxID=34286 RepID=A0A7J8W2A9_9ROSI|nr:hypothetical protein [Gossypium klotzschianum]
MAKTHMKAGHHTLNCQKQPMTPKPNHHVQNIEFKNVKDWVFDEREPAKKKGRMAVFPGKGTEFGKIEDSQLMDLKIKQTVATHKGYL